MFNLDTSKNRRSSSLTPLSATSRLLAIFIMFTNLLSRLCLYNARSCYYLIGRKTLASDPAAAAFSFCREVPAILLESPIYGGSHALLHLGILVAWFYLVFSLPLPIGLSMFFSVFFSRVTQFFVFWCYLLTASGMCFLLGNFGCDFLLRCFRMMKIV